MRSILHIAGRLKAIILQDRLLMVGLIIMATAIFLLVVVLLWVKLRSKSSKKAASKEKTKEDLQEPEEERTRTINPL